MTKPNGLHIGYDATERSASDYAQWFNGALAPLSPHVQQALLIGPVAAGLMPPVDRAYCLLDDGEQAIETGYTIAARGEVRLAIKTPMPNVTPAMWDWWFAWHGSETLRYKLWHPQAHLYAQWRDGAGYTGNYVGRTSHVYEYVGASISSLFIQFIAPSVLGIDEDALAAAGSVAICARVGLGSAPIDFGWLVHQVRPTSEGSEMRSRFWLGGEHLAFRPNENLLAKIASRALPLVNPLPNNIGPDLLVHCAHEMGHLAGFLPQLYETYADR